MPPTPSSNPKDVSPVDLLVIAAHPDDAEIGAGGTVARWATEGRRVGYLLVTSGEKGTDDPAADPQELARTREAEQRAAARVLGVAEVVFLRYPDQGVEDTPELRKEIVRWLRAFRPEVVLTSDPYRRYLWHRDHRMVGQVVLDAVFPYARDPLAYPDLLAEGLRPHKVREVWCWASETPNHRVDITGVFDRKVEALRCHRSQLQGLPFADPAEWLRQKAREAAAGTDYDLAEAFHRAVALP
ncbi:PIG-L deacetylase family protein [Deferrisoma palaeochoriense]